MNRTDAKKKKLLVYNNGKPCKEGHDPAIRVTQTGRCMECEKQYHLDRLEIQKKRNRYHNRKPKYVYQFPLPTGEKIIVGPFTSHLSAMNAFQRRWKVFYGMEFSERIYAECLRKKN